MKKIYFPIFFMLVVCCWLHNTCVAQVNWQSVGTNGIVASSAADQALAVDNKGTLYVAFRDEANRFKATVKKYDGTNWVNVGAVGLSVSYVSGISMVIAPDGTPYVAYTDNGREAKAIVKKFNGVSWVDVGVTGFPVTFAYGAALAVDHDNIPYVAFSDFSKSGKATVKKYTGSNWVEVGTAGFSANHANGITLAIDADNIPYVAYSDNALNGKATVKKYNAGNWINVGAVGFTSSYANDISLAISNDGNPSVIYRDEATGYRATVKKYNGTAWADMGNPGFSAGAVRHTSLVAKGSTAYVSYVDYGSGLISNSGTVVVRKFNGTSWENMGPAGLIASPGKAFDLKMAIAEEGAPYVAYSNEGAGYKATVIKLAAPIPANQAPVANAGSNVTITLPINSVQLSGSGTDADGTVTGYTWRQVGGPKAAVFTSTTEATPTVSGLVAGNYTFGLQAVDNKNSTSPEATVTIIVNPLENVVPVANAGTNKSITLPVTSVTLTGSANDTDGEITAYNWQQVSGPSIAVISNATTNEPTVSALVAGSYVFSLIATDNRNGNSAASKVTVMVNLPVNLVPVANAGSNILVNLPQQAVALTGSGTDPDPDGVIVAYNWEQVSGPTTVTFSDAATANPTVSNLQVGKYILGLTVTDDRGGRSSSSYVTVTVTEPENIMPVANAGIDKTITLPTSAVNLSGSGTDTDGTIENYTWSQVSGPNNAVISNISAAEPAVSGLVAGSYVFSLVVKDNKSGISPADQITVTVQASTVIVQQVVSFTLVNADTDKDIMALTSDAILDLAKLPTKNLNIRANTNPGKVGSVVFALTGARNYNKTETGAPYALFSDQSGNYNAWVPALGSYTLKGTPYKASGGTGTVGTPLTIVFKVINSAVNPTPVVIETAPVVVQQVVSFTLINADTDKDIMTLADGATLNLATLPTKNLNVRANTNINKIGSVVFSLTGAQTYSPIENQAPYALFGGDADYKAWTPVVGNYTLKATPYAESKGLGVRGTSHSINFVVTNQPTLVIAAANTSAVANTSAPVVTTYPNPATTKLYVKSNDIKDGTVNATIYNQTGNVVLTQKINPTVSGLIAELNVTNLAAGRYILVLTTSNGVINRQHVVIE